MHVVLFLHLLFIAMLCVLTLSVFFACIVLGIQKAFIANNVEGGYNSPSSLSSVKQLLGVAQAWGAEYFVAVRDYTIYPSDFFSQEAFSVSES